MADQPKARVIELLEWAYAAGVAAVAMLVVLAGVMARSIDADALPDWFGGLAVAVAAVPGLFVIRYYRRRPVDGEGPRDYAVTVLFRLAVSVLPAALGFITFLATGAWWVQVLGALLCLPGLAWSVPSTADYERHRSLATAIHEHPPDEVWGSAPEGEAGAWESEPGHGHGLHE